MYHKSACSKAGKAIVSVVLLTMIVSFVVGSTSQVSYATPPEEPHGQEEIVTPLQTAMMEAVNERKAQGLPTPASVEYDTQVGGPAALGPSAMLPQGSEAAPPATTVTATTTVYFDNPQQAGYADQWPALTVEGELPPGLSGALQTGDYTALYRERVEKQFPGIWDRYEFGQEPRKYTFTETITISFPDTSPGLMGPRMLGDTTTTSGDILMGFTYDGPDIDYHIESKFEICFFGCFTIYDFWAGFVLKWGAGLRLPADVTVTGPAQLVQGDPYTYSAAVSGSDWSAADYTAAGVAPYDGSEFMMLFVFRTGVRVVLFEVNLCPNCMIDFNLDESASFATPFGAGAEFPIGDISAEIYRIGISKLYFAVIAGMRPHLGSTRITANWQAVPGSDCTGSGTVTFTEPGVGVEFGPISACNLGGSDQAQVELRDFKYWFNQFLLEFFVGFEFNLFGFYHTTKTITVANLDLSRLTGGLYLGSHIQCDWKFTCAPVGPRSVALSSPVSDEDAPTTTISLDGLSPASEWFISDVTATLTAVDNPPGCGAGVKATEYDVNESGWTAYSAPFVLSEERINTVLYRSADLEDNVEEAQTRVVKIDKTPPDITGAPTVEPNEYGWYNTDVIVHFEATDALSGVDEVTPDQTLALEGADQSVTGTATDVAGNSASYTVTGISIDKTPPVVTIFSPEGRTYENVESFVVDWLVEDALSGVASEAGQIGGVSVTDGQLVELLLVPAGTHSLAVQGVDKAGNAAGAAVTFVVVTDIDGLLASLDYMCELGWINKPGICNSLRAKLEATKAALERERLNAAENMLNAFINELEAQVGKAVSQAAYDVLKPDALYVMDHFVAVDVCPDDPDKVDPGICGCGVADIDSDGDGTFDCSDTCPTDVNKTAPGACGCGVLDTDSDGDGTPNCLDQCRTDPDKVEPGDCGCGVPDTDTDRDGAPDCVDLCAADPAKTLPGFCGCGIPDTDADGDGMPDCLDECAADPDKTLPGICGCGVADADSDGDGAYDCQDDCPANPSKTQPGVCGCSLADTDFDGDGTVDCLDQCPGDPYKDELGVCGCGVADTDSDHDGTPDCQDQCPSDPSKLVPGICGCGIGDEDSDGDGTANCQDVCVEDPAKTEPGICGCGVADNPTDTDGDGRADCVDQCPTDPAKVEPGICGCGTPEGTC